MCYALPSTFGKQVSLASALPNNPIEKKKRVPLHFVECCGVVVHGQQQHGYNIKHMYKSRDKILINCTTAILISDTGYL